MYPSLKSSQPLGPVAPGQLDQLQGVTGVTAEGRDSLVLGLMQLALLTPVSVAVALPLQILSCSCQPDRVKVA